MKIAANKLDHAESIHAVLTVDEQGREGLAGMMTDEGWIALVALNPALVVLLEEQAQAMARAGIHIRVVRFTKREDLYDINTGTPQPIGGIT